MQGPSIRRALFHRNLSRALRPTLESYRKSVSAAAIKTNRLVVKTRAIRGPAERQKNGAFKKIEEMLEVL